MTSYVLLQRFGSGRDHPAEERFGRKHTCGVHRWIARFGFFRISSLHVILYGEEIQRRGSVYNIYYPSYNKIRCNWFEDR